MGLFAVDAMMRSSFLFVSGPGIFELLMEARGSSVSPRWACGVLDIVLTSSIMVSILLFPGLVT